MTEFITGAAFLLFYLGWYISDDIRRAKQDKSGKM
jgi:hypothetical protein